MPLNPHHYLALLIPAVTLMAIFALPPRAHAGALVIEAKDHGVIGDGKTDDGPAIQEMLRAAEDNDGPVLIRFEADKTYFVATGDRRYVFNLTGVRDWTIDGGGGVFLVDKDLRFMSLIGSRGVTVRDMAIDMAPLPFAEAHVVGKNADEKWIDVTVDAGYTTDLGGPTGEDGEQLFFAMLWRPGAHTWESNHYVVDKVEPRQDSPRLLRVFLDPKHPIDFNWIDTATTRISLPVPGVAHRYGPGHLLRIESNRDVLFENIDVWSAPWFAFGIYANRGEAVFRNVNVRPKPGSTRMTSVWRDAFHVKNNRAALLFEDCEVVGSNDDAFHIGAHTAYVVGVDSPTRFRIQQRYPLDVADVEPGDRLGIYDPERGIRYPDLTVTSAEGYYKTALVNGKVSRPAPVITIVSRTPIDPGVVLNKTIVWNITSANPDTTLRRCTINQSCRFRSPMKIEDCDITGLVWLYGDELECPIPQDVTISGSTFRQGRGNPTSAIVLNSYAPPQPDGTEPAARRISFENNEIYGDFSARDVSALRLVGNRFMNGGGRIQLRNVRDVFLDANYLGERPLDASNLLDIHSDRDAREIRFSK
jgi:hypothetical protein